MILLVPSASAVDVEKKFRVSVQLGGYNATSKIRSEAANTLIILEEDLEFKNVLRDPRDDSAALGSLKINGAPRIMATVQYAVNKVFVIEAAVGYQTGDVGDVEVQGQYTGVVIPDREFYKFDAQRVPAGEVEQVPIQVTAIARFRPRAKFNPYIGIGVGYTFVGYKLSPELDTLSQRLDASRGQFTPVQDQFGNFDDFTFPTEDMIGAEIIAPDFFSWHLAGGAEYSFKRRWALYADFRYMSGSRDFQLRFNGNQSLGIAVPNYILQTDEIAANPENYGPVTITEGGLLDGGQLIPNDPGGLPESEWPAFCASSPNDCTFDDTVRDGVPDAGRYYVQGGSLKYGGLSASVGVRFTF